MTIRTEKKEVPDRFPPARLYLDDLEEIASVFRDLVNAKAAKREEEIAKLVRDPGNTKAPKQEPEATLQFTFKCAGKSCDDIQEVSKVLKSLRDFSMEVRRGYDSLSLDCDPWLGTRWDPWSFRPPDRWSGFSKLEPIFQKRKRHWSAFFHSHGILSYLTFYVVMILPFALGNFLYNRTKHTVAVTAAVLLSAALLLAAFRALRHTPLVPRYSWEPSPLRRFVTEKGTPAIITGIIGLLTGALLMYLKHKYFP